MINLFRKNENTFAIICIVIYVVGFSVCDSLSKSIGMPYLFTCIFGAVMLAVLFGFVKKNGLMEYFGLCGLKKSGREMLWFIPVIIFTTTNLWTGVALNTTVAGTVFGIITMIFVGFLEEIIFRGFLFRSMEKSNVTTAMIVSALTFGIGHISNLLRGEELGPTLLQIVYASAIGFCFVLIFCISKSIVPCIISHGLFNSFSIIAGDRSVTMRFVIIAVIIAFSLAYAFYLFNIYRRENKKA